MLDEIVHVEVTTVEERRRPSVFWRIFWLVALISAIALFIWLLPWLWVLLVAAIVLAALSTAKLARRRALWETHFGKSAETVGVMTFIRFLAAWFFGILALVPFALLLIAAGVIGIAILFVIAILALVASLFSVE
jgi:hypothetical protein